MCSMITISILRNAPEAFGSGLTCNDNSKYWYGKGCVFIINFTQVCD